MREESLNSYLLMCAKKKRARDADAGPSSEPFSKHPAGAAHPLACKERKKTDNPREGWENGTPPPHRDFKERSVMR